MLLPIQKSLDLLGFYDERRMPGRLIARSLKDVLANTKFKSVRVSKLKALDSGHARENTLSSRYGLNAFPAHTDFAGEDNPARYIVLACPVRRKANTHLFDIRALESDVASLGKKALFRVERQFNPFIAKAIETKDDVLLLRYNRDIMTPINKEAEKFSRVVSEDLPTVRTINWNQTGFVIIDNWRCLHSREAVSEPSLGWIWRIGIWT